MHFPLSRASVTVLPNWNSLAWAYFLGTIILCLFPLLSISFYLKSFVLWITAHLLEILKYAAHCCSIFIIWFNIKRRELISNQSTQYLLQEAFTFKIALQGLRYEFAGLFYLLRKRYRLIRTHVCLILVLTSSKFASYMCITLLFTIG